MLSHGLLAEGVEGIRKLLQHSQLHEVVLVVAVLLVVLVLLVPDVLLLSLALDPVELEDFEGWEQLAHDVFGQGPHQEPSDCEDYRRLRALPQPIAVNGPDLVLSSRCGTLRSSSSVECQMAPAR